MRLPLTALLIVTLATLLSACDSGDGGGPAPLRLTVDATPKFLRLSWDNAGNGTTYTLQYSHDGGRTFPDEEPAKTVIVPSAHLVDWERDQFRLSACVNGQCRYSAAVPLKSLLPDLVGIVNAPAPSTGYNFGGQIALSADGSVLAVSEIDASSRIPGTEDDCDAAAPTNCLEASGAVHVYFLVDDQWRLQASIKASNAGAGDRFGESIALSGAGDILVVGAYGEDSPAVGVSYTPPAADACDGRAPVAPCAGESGAVYVFARRGNAWVQDAYLKSPHSRAGDWFGDEMAISRDGGTLAVGAMYEDGAGKEVTTPAVVDCDAAVPVNCAEDAGAVFLYKLQYQAIELTGYVKSASDAPTTGFGALLALSGDGQILAATYFDEAGHASNVSIFGTWTGSWAWYGSYWSNQDDDTFWVPALDYYGVTLALGAPYLEQGSGVVFVYGTDDARTAPWSSVREIRAPMRSTNTGFGYAVALDDSGYLLAVGSPWEPGDESGLRTNAVATCMPEDHARCAQGSGAVYVYSDNGTEWTLGNTFKHLANERFFTSEALPWWDVPSADLFGNTVALSADGATLAVSAPLDDSGHAGVYGNGADDCESASPVNCVQSSGSVVIY